MSSGIKNTEHDFWMNVQVGNDCWEWQKTLAPNGYGRMRWQGRWVLAHRLSYRFFSGADIPKGMYICHHCDNKKCVNPFHLFLGTPKENAADMVKKKRCRFGKDARFHHKLEESDIPLIRAMSQLGLSQVAIGKWFSVSKSTIGFALNGRCWSTVN